VLLDADYREIADASGTVFLDTDGIRIPVLIDVEDGLALGYDPAKCRRLVGESAASARILTFPVHELGSSERRQFGTLLAEAEPTALYFSDHHGDESGALSALLEEAGLSHDEIPLEDPRARAGDEQAALLLFSCGARQRVQPERAPRSLQEVHDHYRSRVGASATADGAAVTVLLMGDTLTDGQADEMWRIYDAKFDFLGESHPISMQDSKEGFFEMLRSGHTMIAATYRVADGVDELVCFTYFIDDMRLLFWLDSAYLEREFRSLGGQSDTMNVFTPGLVSTGVDRSYAPLSIGLFARACDEAGTNMNVVYENTNLSKRYVPRIVDGAMKRRSEGVEIASSRVVDEVIYRLWSIRAAD
jgi:hypothetical protein